jgi:rhamnosyltransferase
MNRLAVFTIYDKNGIIDDYVIHYIKELKTVSQRVTVCVNGLLSDEGREKLQTVTDDIFVRKNSGLDAGMVKDTLLNHIGFETVTSFDELIIANDTCFGPFIPMTEIVAKAEESGADFYGMGIHEEKGLGIAKYIFSWFYIIRGELLKSPLLQEFFQKLNPNNNKSDAVVNYEFSLTELVVKNGFSYDTYIDYSKMPYAETENAPFDNPGLLIKTCRFPFLKKAVFAANYARYTKYNFYEYSYKTIDFIKSEYDFDTNLIWDSLLRTGDAVKLVNDLNLRFILRGETAKAETSAAFVIYLCYAEQLFENIEFIRSFPENIHAVLLVKNGVFGDRELAILREIPRSEIRFTDENIPLKAFAKCTDIFENYKFTGFVSDLKNAQNLIRGQSEKFLQRECFSGEFTDEIISLFERDEKFGFSVSPSPVTNPHFRSKKLSKKDKNKLKAIYKDLGIYGNTSKRIMAHSFFCRTDSLKKLPVLLSHKDLSSDLLSIVMPYLAQSEGFYVAEILTENRAAAMLLQTDLQFGKHSTDGLNLRAKFRNFVFNEMPFFYQIIIKIRRPLMKAISKAKNLIGI